MLHGIICIMQSTLSQFPYMIYTFKLLHNFLNLDKNCETFGKPKWKIWKLLKSYGKWSICGANVSFSIAFSKSNFQTTLWLDLTWSWFYFSSSAGVPVAGVGSRRLELLKPDLKICQIVLLSGNGLKISTFRYFQLDLIIVCILFSLRFHYVVQWHFGEGRDCNLHV